MSNIQNIYNTIYICSKWVRGYHGVPILNAGHGSSIWDRHTMITIQVQHSALYVIVAAIDSSLIMLDGCYSGEGQGGAWSVTAHSHCIHLWHICHNTVPSGVRRILVLGTNVTRQFSVYTHNALFHPLELKPNSTETLKAGQLQIRQV